MLASMFLLNSLVQTSCAGMATCRTMASAALRLSRKIRKGLDESNQILPVKPKKPLTSYLRYVIERKGELMGEKKMTVTEMAVVLSQEWKTIDRTKYEDEYSKERKKYLKKMEEYEQSLTNEQKEAIMNKKYLTKENKLLSIMRKTKLPTRPRNAANIFCAQKLNEPKYNSNLKARKQSDVFSELFQEYRALNEEEKKKYIRLQENDKIRFQHEFNNWYESVLSDMSLPKAARERAEELRTKYKLLSYV